MVVETHFDHSDLAELELYEDTRRNLMSKDHNPENHRVVMDHHPEINGTAM